MTSTASVEPLNKGGIDKKEQLGANVFGFGYDAIKGIDKKKLQELMRIFVRLLLLLQRYL